MQMDLMDRSPKDWWMQSSLQLALACPARCRHRRTPRCYSRAPIARPSYYYPAKSHPSIHATNQKGKIKLGLELARVCNRLSAYINGVSSWIDLETQVLMMYVNLILVCSGVASVLQTWSAKWAVSWHPLTYCYLACNFSHFFLPAGVHDFKMRQKVDKMQICALEDICVLHRWKSTNSHSCNYIMIWTALSRSTVDHRSLHWGKTKWVEIIFEDAS